jgi:hypothetical protein
MARRFRYVFELECISDGVADEQKMHELIDLAIRGLVDDEEFIRALDEKEAVSVDVIKLDR